MNPYTCHGVAQRSTFETKHHKQNLKHVHNNNYYIIIGGRKIKIMWLYTLLITMANSHTACLM